MKLVTTRVGDCCNAHIFLTHFSIIRQLIIGSHSDYHLLGNNPSAALNGRHLPLHKGGFGTYRTELRTVYVACSGAAMGAPAKPSVSGFAGERRSSGATALSALKAETKDAELATTRW